MRKALTWIYRKLIYDEGIQAFAWIVFWTVFTLIIFAAMGVKLVERWHP